MYSTVIKITKSWARFQWQSCYVSWFGPNISPCILSTVTVTLWNLLNLCGWVHPCICMGTWCLHVCAFIYAVCVFVCIWLHALYNTYMGVFVYLSIHLYSGWRELACDVFSNFWKWFSWPVGNGTQVRIARIFNTYGPRMCIDDGRVVSNFVAQVYTPSLCQLNVFCILCCYIVWNVGKLYRLYVRNQWLSMGMANKQGAFSLFLILYEPQPILLFSSCCFIVYQAFFIAA